MISGTFNFMIVFQAEHNILMHPFHMLGENYASPSVQHCLYCRTFLCFWIPQNLVHDKRGIETRLNGESPKSFAFNSENHGNQNVFDCHSLSADSNNSTQDNPVPNRMSPRQLPGVYSILCLANNKRYYGESKNVSQRISQHKSKLKRNIHEIPELQRDFNIYGLDSFEFSCVYISKDFTLEQRRALEIELIGRFFDLCYNKFTKPNHLKENNPFFGKTHSGETRRQISKSLKENHKNSTIEGFPILLDNQIYPSISEASRQTKHSRDTIRRWLNDPNKTNCIAVNSSKPQELSSD